MTSATTLVRPEDIAPGHLIDFLSSPILVATVEPYSHPTVPEFFAVARDAKGRGMSLAHGNAVRVLGTAV